MAGIDELISTFMGQAQQGMNAPPAPWQQELLETVNPEKVKRQNIARALAQASTAMATTPGNFLAGVSAAAATGADSYLTGKDQAEDQRMKVQQLLGMQQQKDQDRRLSLLMDAIGVTRGGIQDKERAEDRVYDRQDRAENRKIRREESESRKAYWDRRGAGANGTLSTAQIQTNKRAVRNELRWFEGQLNDQIDAGDIAPEDKPRMLEEKRMELEDYYGVSSDDAPSVQQPPTVAPGKTDQIVQKNGGTTQQAPSFEAAQSGITGGPGGIREGTTIVNRQTGQRMILKDGQWQPL